MRRAAWLLLLAPLSAEAEGSRREKVEAIVEQEARRADERARPRKTDRLAGPMELAWLEALAAELGLELLSAPVSRDAALERQRRLEALRVEVYRRLAPLEPDAFGDLARAAGAATRAVEHRVARLELEGLVPEAALAALVHAGERDPNLRAMLFVHGEGPKGARRERAIHARLEGEPAHRDGRLRLARSGLPRAGATMFLARLAPSSPR